MIDLIWHVFLGRQCENCRYFDHGENAEGDPYFCALVEWELSNDCADDTNSHRHHIDYCERWAKRKR